MTRRTTEPEEYQSFLEEKISVACSEYTVSSLINFVVDVVVVVLVAAAADAGTVVVIAAVFCSVTLAVGILIAIELFIAVAAVVFAFVVNVLFVIDSPTSAVSFAVAETVPTVAVGISLAFSSSIVVVIVATVNSVLFPKIKGEYEAEIVFSDCKSSLLLFTSTFFFASDMVIFNPSFVERFSVTS